MTDKPRFTMLHGSGQRAEDMTGEMAERIKDVIYEYEGRVTLAAAVGVLHIVAVELMGESLE
jgi:hypothetical protein